MLPQVFRVLQNIGEGIQIVGFVAKNIALPFTVTHYSTYFSCFHSSSILFLVKLVPLLIKVFAVFVKKARGLRYIFDYSFFTLFGHTFLAILVPNL